MDTGDLEQIQADYLKRLSHQLRSVPKPLQEDALREVKAHIEDGRREHPDDMAVLQAVLERLGPPEEYGRELGLQLMLQANRIHPSLNLIIWTGLFWASSSLAGAFAVVGSTILYFLGLAFVLDGVIRLVDPNSTVYFFRANEFILPPRWWPPLNMILGILLLPLLTVGLKTLLRGWGRGKLGERGLAATLNRQSLVFPKGWETRAGLTIGLVAFMGLFGCSFFGAIGGLFPFGKTGTMALPNDFFRNPFNFIAFLFSLAFLLSPVLGLLLAIRQEQKVNNAGGDEEKDQQA